MILPGTAVELDMILEFKKPLIIKGTVIWIADKDLQPDFYPGIGVAFENIPSRVQENIIEFIEKNTVHRSS
jgi:Tfp pilus assembly protein PilZ